MSFLMTRGEPVTRRVRPSLKRAGGSMFVMTILVLGIIITVLGIGATVYFLFFSHRRIQSQADALTLKAAQILNVGDNVGQMNNLVAQSRELVFNSRQMHRQTLQKYGQLEPLARQLLEESRSGAHLVAGERARLSSLCVRRVLDVIKAEKAEIRGTTAAWIPGMKVMNPIVNNLDVGFIEDVSSNVGVGKGNPSLEHYDMTRQYIQQDSGLYFANINAKLPAPDDDLEFKLTSLPAPVDGSIAPPRLASPRVFRVLARIIQDEINIQDVCEQIPSAVRLDYLMSFKSSDYHQDQHEVVISAAASTGGAYPPR